MGELRTRATMDDRPFRAGIDRMDRSVAGVGRRMGQIKNIIAGAFAVGGITTFIRSIADLGSELSDMVTQTGVGARSLQGLLHATRLAGAEQQKMVMALSQVRDAMGTVLRGGEGSEVLRQSFEALGISLQDLASLNTDQVLERMAGGFASAGRSAESFSSLVDIMGRRNTPQLIEVLNRLASEGLDGVATSAEKAGQVMDEKYLSTLDKIADRWNEISRSIKIGAVNLTGGLLPDTPDPVSLSQKQLAIVEEMTKAEQNRIVAIEAAERARADAIKADEESFDQFMASYNKVMDEVFKRQSQVDPAKAVGASTSNVDQLTRIGGMLGGRGNNDMSRLIQEQQRIRSHVAAIQRDVERQKRVTIAEP